MSAKKTARPRPAAASPAKKGNSFLVRGESLLQTVAEQKRLAEEREHLRAMGIGGHVSDFWLNKGESSEIIILDSRLTDGAGMWEHNLRNAKGKFGNRVLCAKTMPFPCPICEAGDYSSFLTKLSVLELREWTTKGGELITHSKRILPLNMRALEKFQVYEKAAIKKYGTFRGVQFRLQRGTDQTSQRIGEIVPNDDGENMVFWTEDELAAEFGHDARKGRDGKTVMAPADFDITPYDYDELYKAPVFEDLVKVASYAGASDEEAEDDRPPSRGTRTAARKQATRRAPEPEPEPDADEEEMDTGTEEAESWASYGATLDSEAVGEDEAMTAAAEEAGLDPDDYATWEELGTAIDEATGEAEEEEAEEEEAEASGEEPTWAEKGAATDDESEDYSEELTAEATDWDVDPNDYGTWEALGAELDEFNAGSVEPAPAPKAKRPAVAAGRKAPPAF